MIRPMRHTRSASVVLLAAALLAKDQTDWKHGKRVFTYTVDGGDKVYNAVEVGKPIHVAVNG